MNEDKKPKNKRQTVLLVVILVLIIVLLAGVLAWFLTHRGGAEEEEFSDDFFDPFAQTGILPDMSEEQIQEELNRVVEEGMLNVSIAGRIIFDDGAGQGKANIVNSEANHYIQKVRLELVDTGEVLYESGGIKPGQYIQFITLDRDLDPGEYSAAAVFTAYTIEERQLVGSTSARVTILVKD